MNQPSRADRFVLPEGERKLSYERDTKVENAGTFVLQREDHTIGNLLRMELHKNPDVVFAGYKNPHPTDHRIVLKVHTNANTTPVQALRDAVTNLRAEVGDLSQQFADEINALRRE
ncbi:predicted protein [Ostreococcus lucimarinus CCE9901]|uniref:DNA-directed RNA polymerase RBP11-like dimerisation domain-containing protein n=1 Tax=Ostreococcus lucimarinus (strain CCE9901) TaxID=436017 RepID=A4S056_OSTLU|nr:predicted protein [Ostreococcus lucimarinus CCE9901]ABO96977.1 predicted protein [Ostreococcus lucimarinus CCE9901]|eukprot:XP_001418684.1 predicted protein [Ostreococcus lucimarinus CCE9901]